MLPALLQMQHIRQLTQHRHCTRNMLLVAERCPYPTVSMSGGVKSLMPV